MPCENRAYIGGKGGVPMIFLTVLLLLLAGCMLINSQVSLSYANLGLELWFQKMIPALGPFMILSGIMVRLNLTEKAALAACPVVKPLYRVRENVVYAMVCGFLCGFPMGAKVVEDLYTRQRITRREAEYLLAFCNNIGPIYFVSFVLPLLGRKLVAPYLLGMYGIPLLYGLLLRWTVYRDLNAPRHSGESSSRRKNPPNWSAARHFQPGEPLPWGRSFWRRPTAPSMPPCRVFSPLGAI
jgi:hypothetical protein